MESHPGPSCSQPATPAPSADCLTDSALAALVDPLHPTPDPSVAEQHLESCPHCQQRLETLSGLKSIELSSAHLAHPTSDNLSPEASTQLQNLLLHLRLGSTPNLPQEPFLEEVGLFDPPPQSLPQALGELAGYTLLDRIAAGGMGMVYRAWDAQLGRVVALKILRPSLALNPESRSRFTREARAAAAVVHDHVVAIHSVGEHKGIPFLVMGFVKGKSLEQRLHQNPLSLTEILRIGAQIARGLAAAHAQGLVHRDIKPSNILLENSVERVKLVDFGLAHATDDTRLTQEGVMAGTPEYVAPEQVRGEPISPAVDQFSLGCVLYACLQGESPFKSDSTLGTLRRIADSEPIPIHHSQPQCPPWLSSLIHRLLAKQPTHRFPNMNEVAELLEQALARLNSGESPSSWPPLPLPAHASIRSKRRVAIAVGLTSTLLLVLALIPFFPFNSSSPKDTPRADYPPNAFKLISSKGSSTTFFNELHDAAQAAQSEDIIEIAATGEIQLENALKLGNRAITLRAAHGHHPILTSTNSLFTLIFSEGPLTLQGLELRGPGKGSDQMIPGEGEINPNRNPATLQRGDIFKRLVVVTRGPFRAQYCKFVAPLASESAYLDCIGLESVRSAQFDRCEFYNSGGGILSWRNRNITPDTPNQEVLPQEFPWVSYTQCFSFTREGFLIGQNVGPRATWIIDHSSFLSLNLLRLLNRSDHHFSISNSILCLRFNFGGAPRNVVLTNHIKASFSSNLLLAPPANIPMRMVATLDPTSIGPFDFDATWKQIGARHATNANLSHRAIDFAPTAQELESWPDKPRKALLRLGPTLSDIGPGEPWSRQLPPPKSP